MPEEKDKIKSIPLNSKGYGTIAKLAMQDQNLDIAAKAVYAYFNSFTGNGDNCFPTRKKICYDLKISNDTLGKYLRQLVETGYISIEQIKENGRFSHNIYTINGAILPYPKISDTEETDTEKPDTNNNNLKNNNVIKKNNTKKSPFEPFMPIITSYAAKHTMPVCDEIADLLTEWLKVRKAKRAAMTERAIQMNIDKLDDIAAQSKMSVTEYIKEIICRGWSAFYVINNYSGSRPAAPPQENNTQIAKYMQATTTTTEEDSSLYDDLI